ncbi:MAG TPA: FAD-dependent oxidoreductase, partial [Planctomycetaceae bacterium]|nr:FAD-dependent oxidoreductase [Planctomycetaceae bacterium]
MAIATNTRSIRRVIVIGAGPAGAAAAMRLHDQGRSVLWVDRSDFP